MRSGVPLVEMTIELDVTNLSREGLVASSSTPISTKMIGPGISGSAPSYSGNLAGLHPYPPLATNAQSTITGHRTVDLASVHLSTT